MNFLIPMSFHVVLLCVAVWGLFGAVFMYYGEWDMFIKPQKFLLKKTIEFCTYFILLPLTIVHKQATIRYRKEVILIMAGSLINSLIIIFYYLYKY